MQGLRAQVCHQAAGVSACSLDRVARFSKASLRLLGCLSRPTAGSTGQPHQERRQHAAAAGAGSMYTHPRQQHEEPPHPPTSLPTPRWAHPPAAACPLPVVLISASSVGHPTSRDRHLLWAGVSAPLELWSMRGNRSACPLPEPCEPSRNGLPGTAPCHAHCCMPATQSLPHFLLHPTPPHPPSVRVGPAGLLTGS